MEAGQPNLCAMRTALIAAAVLAACTSSAPPPPPDTQAVQADTEALLKPVRPEAQRGPIAGFVSARDMRTLSLDSGGQHLIPLKVDDKTLTMRDGQRGSIADIREGDVVRAAYSLDADGTPRATQIVVNSRPITGRATPPGTNAAQPAQEQQATAQEQPATAELQPGPVVRGQAGTPDARTGEMPTVMEVSPVETRQPASAQAADNAAADPAPPSPPSR
jgi:hypothetical protein